MTMTSTLIAKPFDHHGLSASKVRQHFQAGDRVAVNESTRNNDRHLRNASPYVHLNAILLSTETHIATTQWQAGGGGTTIVRKALGGALGPSWQKGGVGFPVAVLRSDGTWRPTTVKIVFGPTADAEAFLAESARRNNEARDRAAAFKAHNVALGAKIKIALDERLMAAGEGAVPMWAHETEAGRAPRLTLEQMAAVLGIEVES